jgi:HSP20 family protein
MPYLNELIPSGERSASAPAATRKPRYEVSETDNAYRITVSLPGVAKDGLQVTDDNGELRISASLASALPEGRVALYRETSDAPFDLVLAHDNTVDTEKIGAELRDGVLSLTLAKSESAKPRKIAVS